MKKTISTPGRYLTKEGKVVTITRISGDRAHGCFPDSHDTTWWYATSGEHGVYTPDDIVKPLTEDVSPE